MNAREAIKASMETPNMIVRAYLEDLTDDELMVRPIEGANHIAWQLGHLINSEHNMIEMVCPDSMPPLPAGFAEKYTNETSGLDDADEFHTKADYLKAFEQQREGTLAALEGLSDEDLDRPSPEPIRHLGRTVAAIFSMQPTHWLMHAGQWAVIRRKLGRVPLF